jgi:hypothetical protein
MTAAITAAIKTWGAHTEPPKHRIETAGTDNPSSGADDDGVDTAAQFRSTAPVVR